MVAARDTAILLLLIAHFHKIPCSKVWLKCGTSKKRKYVPIHTIVENLQLPPDVLESVVAFHAITGSDCTSYFNMHSKRTCWRIFLECPELLKNLGVGELSNETACDAEKLVCKYMVVDHEFYQQSQMPFVHSIQSNRITATNKRCTVLPHTAITLPGVGMATGQQTATRSVFTFSSCLMMC